MFLNNEVVCVGCGVWLAGPRFEAPELLRVKKGTEMTNGTHEIVLTVQGIQIRGIVGIIKSYAGSENFFGYKCVCGAEWGAGDFCPIESHYTWHLDHCAKAQRVQDANKMAWED